MNPVEPTIGHILGQEGVEKIVEQIESYCECEKQRIECVNLPALKTRQAEIALLWERREELLERIRQLPPEGDLRTRRRHALAYWALVAFLIMSGTYFTKLSFDPFRFATNPYLYSIGIALTITFLGDRFLSNAGKYAAHLYRTVLTTAFAATLTALVLLAVIRGDLLMQKLKSESTETVTIEDDTRTVPTENTFFQDSAILLCITLPLLAIGMDLGAGIALHEARRLSAESTDNRKQLSQELDSVSQQMIAKHFEVTSLKIEPVAFEKQFWRDFYYAMLTRTAKNAMKKILVLGVALVLFSTGHVFAQEPTTNMVILVDLSKSVAAQGQPGESPCEKNFKAVGRVLESTSAGTRITVLGITADSFGEPDVLLSAQVSNDPGYFGEKLTNARQTLSKIWQKRSEHLKCNAQATDILGTLLVAEQIFKENSAVHSELIIFSDMRQDTKEFNLESTGGLASSRKLFNRLAANHLIPDLHGVSVNILGVDNIGNSLERWHQVEAFWKQYFQIANADMREYSVIRNQIRR